MDFLCSAVRPLQSSLVSVEQKLRPLQLRLQQPSEKWTPAQAVGEPRDVDREEYLHFT